ncbi:MAG: FIST C-terminal domain-containing protein [Gammaproteobacteria bacterium]|nr:FIST C-terminal domain-containing protein [Gammaproteobacteria bacterium]
MTGRVAGSGISFGRPHATRHVERAVSAAMEAARLDQVMGLFLFLTDDHLQDLEPALRAAARVSRCTQVFGCSAMGLFTDQDWTVDSSGAAALVVGNGVSMGLENEAGSGGTLISLGTPRDASVDWLNQGGARLGAIASDSSGRGPFAVWRNGRPEPAGVAACALDGVRLETVVARGVLPLTAPLEVAEANGFNLVRLGKYPALNVLINALPDSIRRMDRIPLHMLMCGVTFGDPDSAIDEGRFRLDHIVSANPDDHSVTLADELHEGQRLFWALRDRQAAEREMERVVGEALDGPEDPPDFGLMFSCLGRGPGFYGGADRDIEILREQCPGMPFAGFYGNGEIAPVADRSHLYSYTAAIGLCRRIR